MSSIVKSKSIGAINIHNDIINQNYKFDEAYREAEIPAINLSDERQRILEASLRDAINKWKAIEKEAKARADSIVLQAEDKSAKIFLDARQEGLEKGYEQGLEQGYLEGFEAGKKAAKQDAQEGLSELNRLVELIRTEQRAGLWKNEKDLLSIAFEISRKIMRRQVMLDGGLIPAMLKEIIGEHESDFKIYLSEYQETLGIKIEKSIADKIKNSLGGAKTIFVEEPDVILVETENEMIDMSIPVQMKKIKDAIEEDALHGYEEIQKNNQGG